MVAFPEHMLGSQRPAYDQECVLIDQTYTDPRLRQAHREETFRKLTVLLNPFGAPEHQVTLSKRENACRIKEGKPFACDGLVLTGIPCNPDCPAAKV